ncbi:OsmC family protein [Natranaerobius trueperi]|nr:OsmC family protein [Natranaerobius trueperi]
MKSKIVWDGNLTFIGTGENSCTEVTLDASKQAGGDDNGPSPMEMMLMSLASCASIDMVLILSKKRKKKITEYWVEAFGKRRDETPKYFEKIHMTFHLKGEDLNNQEVKKALELTEEKYCSVWHCFDPDKTEITYDYVIH